MATYKVLVGIDYSGKRVEPGALVSDLPPKSVSWLVAQGVVEATETVTREPKSPTKGDK